MTTSDFQPIYQCPAIAGPVKPAAQLRWLLVDEQSQALDRNDPTLQQIELSVRFDYLVIRAPGMLRLDIPVDVLEDDEEAFEEARLDGRALRVVSEGQLADAWFSKLLERPVRLVKLHPEENLTA
ncbi:MOSC N-terminal beta barrel domain-containing protein [Advenella mimigardefordensis]|uniref:MOSC domain-containing protein n=1 Tax=Advenella mimigardefordensis (strain DSM 17166 / LMG 22922 / DPN7) TaxID=1247726 RepID=W0PF58_ADVMD|nr:MOSC N-terminal beta barrel domain-containing protein [Advenella mimigardefordensis]AHG65291.1 MOSC domain-containing protein [Advenella mimigardefordensis DPN7]